MMRQKLVLLIWIVLCGVTPMQSQDTGKSPTQTNSPETATVTDNPEHQAVAAIVARIQRADYEGNRPGLDTLYDELTPWVGVPQIASRVRYWRGFAKWRNAINGFNETPTPKDLAKELTEGESEFDAAILRDPDFVDAKVGAASCILLRLFLGGGFSKAKNPAQLREAMAPASKLLKAATTVAPDNPRLLWVVGPNQWATPVQFGGGQSKAFETYNKGLAAIRAQKGTVTDPLEPSWGEPELLMNLAWSNLHRDAPDLPAAEQYALASLALVPYWHYVRDILMLQIETAKTKAK